MSMKKIYTCNIHGEKIENPDDSFGVYFKNLKDFTLSRYDATEGIHICYQCAKQLKEHLCSPEITKLLTSFSTRLKDAG